MTLNEIIYDVREKLKLNSDDIDITDQYLAHLTNVKRLYLIKQRFAKFSRNIPEEIKQIICVDLEVVDSINGEPCFGKVLRSTVVLPTLMEIGGNSAILSIRTLDVLYPSINIIHIDRLPYVGYNKWLKKQIYVALDADNRLYFRSDNPQHLNLEFIKVIGVFTDPEIAQELDCEQTDPNCDYYNSEYPIEPYLVHDLINLIVKELAPSLNIPNDKINNSDESNRN
jgi:hypothetical protein